MNYESDVQDADTFVCGTVYASLNANGCLAAGRICNLRQSQALSIWTLLSLTLVPNLGYSPGYFKQQQH